MKATTTVRDFVDGELVRETVTVVVDDPPRPLEQIPAIPQTVPGPFDWQPLHVTCGTDDAVIQEVDRRAHLHLVP